MKMQPDYRPLSCAECAAGAGLDFDFTMAYQPIVDVQRQEVFSYEALVRGMAGESAASILARVTDQNRYRFDQACRSKAISWAARLGISTYLNINFLPNAVYRPETCIQSTLEAAQRWQFPVERIIFEVTEGEFMEDHAHLNAIFQEYQKRGFKTAIDDFGAGDSGLNMLAEFQPDFIKLDMALIRNLDRDRVRKAIVKGIVQVCQELAIRVVAEGVESREELRTLRDLGIQLVQGYLFARPSSETLPPVLWPGAEA